MTNSPEVKGGGDGIRHDVIQAFRTDLQENGFLHVWLYDYVSDYEAEKKSKRLIEEVDAILEKLGINKETLPNYFLDGFGENGAMGITADMITADSGESLGEILHKYAYLDFYMEEEEASDVCVDWAFRLEDMIFNLRCHGEFWTERDYIDPTTGAKVSEGNMTEEQQASYDRGDMDDWNTDPKITWTLKAEFHVYWADSQSATIKRK